MEGRMMKALPEFLAEQLARADKIKGDNCPIRPSYDRVIVFPIKDNFTKGGVIVPETAQQMVLVGFVLDVGPGIQLANGTTKEPQAKIGEYVMYRRFNYPEVKLGGQSLHILGDSDIMAVFRSVDAFVNRDLVFEEQF